MSRAISGRWVWKALTLGACALQLACVRGEDEIPAQAPPPTPTPAVADGRIAEGDISVPAQGFLGFDPQEVERGRLDAAWRTAAERDLSARQLALAGATPGTAASSAASPAATPLPSGSPAPAGSAPQAPVGAETWESIGPDAFEGAPRLPLGGAEAAGPTVLRVQRLLARAGYSPGVVDGHWGKNSEKAVYWLQAAWDLPANGVVDQALYDRLVAAPAAAGEAAGGESPVTRYTVSAEDVAGPYVKIPSEPADQSKLDCLCYQSAAEALAERFHTTPELLARLNPGVSFDALTAGTQLVVPDVATELGPQVATGGAKSKPQRQPDSRIARLLLSKSGWYLQALDGAGNILYHFPVTIGAGYDQTPSGNLKVTHVAFDPDFLYQPKLFAEVPDDEPEHHLAPGPNSPVGKVWMGLSREHFGIHGTAEPETIGYHTSHGCVRMTNWDAVFLAKRIPDGVPVELRD